METKIALAALNDKFRKSGFGVVVTPGIDAFEDEQKAELLKQIRNFNHFTEDNDPYWEHDFGCIYFGQDVSRGIEGKKVFWKIDYYDEKLEVFVNPLLQECKRIMTVMLASEY